MSEQVHDPNRRQWYEFRRDGENMVVSIRVAPGGDVPPHFHPQQEERWTVRSGRVRFKLGRRTLIAPIGEELVVEPGVRHSFRNVGDEEATIVAQVRPALDIEGFLSDAAALARAGVYTRRGVIKTPRDAVRVAELVERYQDQTIVCWPPRSLQRFVLAPLLRRSRSRRGERPVGG